MNLCCMSNRDMVKTWVCSLDMMERSLCVPVSPVEGSSINTVHLEHPIDGGEGEGGGVIAT